APARGEKQRVLSPARKLRPSSVEVVREERRRLFAERDDAVLAALAFTHVHQALLEVDVAEVEPDRLGAAEAGGVDELDERAVAHCQRIVPCESVDDLLDLSNLWRVGQPAGTLRRETRVGHVLRPEGMPQQRAHGNELAPDRRRRETSAGPCAAE